jgi:hypothetical protein
MISQEKDIELSIGFNYTYNSRLLKCALIINQSEEEIVDVLETDGDIPLPAEVLWPNPWMKKMIMITNSFLSSHMYIDICKKMAGRNLIYNKQKISQDHM